MLINGEIIKVPIVKITFDTPYLTKSVEAMCMKNPIYDLVVGNVEDARPPDDPNINWEAKVNQQVGEFVTRGQKVKQEQIAKPLKVVNLETLNTPINTEKLIEMQNNVESLNKIRVPKGVTKKKYGNSWYAVHNGLTLSVS